MCDVRHTKQTGNMLVPNTRNTPERRRECSSLYTSLGRAQAKKRMLILGVGVCYVVAKGQGLDEEVLRLMNARNLEVTTEVSLRVGLYCP